MKRLKFDEVRHIQEPLYPWFGDKDRLEDGVFYIVDDSPYVEWNCPCGCGNTVMIPVRRPGDEMDGWDMTEKGGRVTLSPSVLSSGWPCRSHYFVRNNQICWCE